MLGTLTALHADPPPDGAPRLTLDECVARAERAFPGLAAQRHKILASEAQLDEAWAAPFLNFSATGAVGIAPYARGNPTFSPDAFAQNPFDTGYGTLVRFSIDTGVPISPWTWWRIGRVRDAARAGIRANEHELVKARLELRTNVRRAFFALQLARAGLARESIDAEPPCTYADRARFFSYRRDGVASGRLAAIIAPRA